MKFIKALQAENSELKETISLMNEDIKNLFFYLNSSKFHCGDELDGYVNIQDVFERLKNTMTII